MDRILILEDEPALRSTISRLLSGEQGFDTYDTGTLHEALAALDTEKPDIIVSDLMLPDGSGFELLRELERREKSIPVVFMTAYLERFLLESPALAALDVLTKPFSNAELVDRVRASLADNRLSLAPDSAFTVSDYLQLAGMARRSVILSVKHGEIEGQVVVQNGAPVWAQDKEGTGKTAFQRLALLPRAEVSCSPCTTWSTKPNLEGSLEQMLLDAARVSDEGRRNGGDASPLPRVSPPARVVPRPNSVQRKERSETPGQSGESLAVKPQKVPLPLPSPVTPLPSSTQLLRKDNTMQPVHPLGSKSPEAVLSAVSAIAAVARADREGSMLDFAGEFDAETACAVATLAARPVSEIADELGLGELQSWCLSRGDETWYVVHDTKQLWVAQGAVNKNPVSVLRKIETGARGVT
jgi:DNA-binding response OmpR family regulator